MIPEAPMRRSEGGVEAAGEGWFVVNARDALWKVSDDFGAYTRLGEGEPRFPEFGINLGVLQPGQPACLYHGEENQEDFLVLSGECLLLVEGDERRLEAWDFVHCPAWTEHVLVGAGDGPCLVLAVGSRAGNGLTYPVSQVAQRHGASAETTTSDPSEAYAPFDADGVETPCRDDWLPAR